VDKQAKRNFSGYTSQLIKRQYKQAKRNFNGYTSKQSEISVWYINFPLPQKNTQQFRFSASKQIPISSVSAPQKQYPACAVPFQRPQTITQFRFLRKVASITRMLAFSIDSVPSQYHFSPLSVPPPPLSTIKWFHG